GTEGAGVAKAARRCQAAVGSGGKGKRGRRRGQERRFPISADTASGDVVCARLYTGGFPTPRHRPFTSAHPAPPAPPPRALPPPIPLKYQGYAVSTVPGGTITAFLADDSRHYNVTVGEVLMGRYRILGISDKTVDVEDLEFKRRQSLPIVK